MRSFVTSGEVEIPGSYCFVVAIGAALQIAPTMITDAHSRGAWGNPRCAEEEGAHTDEAIRAAVLVERERVISGHRDSRSGIALLDRGYSERDIQKILGGNILRTRTKPIEPGPSH
jgi:hypothetical protein